MVVYSLWTLRLSRNFASDRRLGYLLCLTDIAILLPLLVWTSSAAMRTVLGLVCAAGLVFSYWADRTQSDAAFQSRRDSRSLEPRPASGRSGENDDVVPLERALRVRLQVLESTRARFALVLLRIVRFEEMTSYYGEEEAEHLVAAVTRRGLRLLGPTPSTSSSPAAGSPSSSRPARGPLGRILPTVSSTGSIIRRGEPRDGPRPEGMRASGRRAPGRVRRGLGRGPLGRHER